MTAGVVRHQHRHYKTLIVLVLAMTGGTYLLYWVAQLSPITRLRSETPSTRVWTDISVRAEWDQAPRGFFHYRIDEAGRLFQSQAWKARQIEWRSPGMIHILLTCPQRDLQVSPMQAETLARLLSQLRSRLEIPADRVQVDTGRGVVSRDASRLRHLRRT